MKQLSKDRAAEYDVLRVFAIVMIVMCHLSIGGWCFSEEVGAYLGSTFNYVFIFMSALMLGRNGMADIVENRWAWLKKRIFRLIPSVYIVLLLCGLFCALEGNPLSVKQMAAHMGFVNWFFKDSRIVEPNMGHLWFVDCIVIAYIFSSLVLGRKWFNRIVDNGKWLSLYVAGGLMAWAAIQYKTGKMEPIGITLLLFPIFVAKSQRLMLMSKKINRCAGLVSLIALNALSAYLYTKGLNDLFGIKMWLNLLCAFSWIFIFPMFFRQKYIPGWLTLLSGISFEIYLIHHPFTMGEHSLLNFFDKPYAVILFAGIVLFGAYAVNKISAMILKVTKHKKVQTVN